MSMCFTVELKKEKLFKLERNSLDSGYWRSPIISTVPRTLNMPSIPSECFAHFLMYHFHVMRTEIAEDSIINFGTPGHQMCFKDFLMV